MLTHLNFLRTQWNTRLHCPICKIYVRDLDRKLTNSCVGVVAISTDSPERGEQSKRDWGIERLAIADESSIEAARRWGLLILLRAAIEQHGMPHEARALRAEPLYVRHIVQKAVLSGSIIRALMDGAARDRIDVNRDRFQPPARRRRCCARAPPVRAARTA